MIEIESLTKKFDGVIVPAIDNINLHIKEGEFCVVLGSNGSGKSTLFKLISKEYEPSAGSVKICTDVAHVTQNTDIGTIPDMTLLENIALSIIRKPKFQFYSYYRKFIEEQIESLGIGLEKFIDQPLRSLSGGQKQIIAVLMSLMSNSKILLLDEHTSALDPKIQFFLMQYTFEQVAKLGLTTLMITHKLEDAIQYGDRLIMLSRGKIVVDLDRKAKQKLQISDLLDLFHLYDDKSLLEGVSNEY